MLLPYRAKNPPEHVPYATIGLIALNIAIYALTANGALFYLFIREGVIRDWAISHDTFSVTRMFSSMFLHEGVFHLAGNMLFLWLFGASVEGRLRPPLYLVVYLLSGLSGDLLHELILGQSHPAQFSLGASGAIMGLAGAYLYMFPYSLICVLFAGRTWSGAFTGGYRAGVSEWQARWVVVMYVGFDILNMLLYKGHDGVGHFAHLGGFGTGLLFCMAIRARRDTEEVSNVQARHADTKDYSLLSATELETLLQRPTEDMNLVVTYCEQAIRDPGNPRTARVVEVLNRYGTKLVAEMEPNRLAWVLLYIPSSAGGLPLIMYLRLASRLEGVTSNDYAARIYRRIYDISPMAPESETALYRLGHLLERVFMNPQHAFLTYNELLRIFPNGQFSLQTRDALRRLQQSSAQPR